jgi:radical SAM-linked protein
MLRVSLKLSKGGERKYLSHRDVIRAFEYALRRAQVPVAYSSGFNPRPRMSFGSAVGVGVTSDDERIVLELASPMSESEMRDTLNGQLPKGLSVVAVEAVPDGVKSPIAALNASEFRMTILCGEGCDPAAVVQAVRKMNSPGELRVVREREGKTKEFDLKPYLLRADVIEYRGKRMVIEVGLKSTDSGGAGPRDFMQALSASVPNPEVEAVHRIRQFHSGNELRRAASNMQTEPEGGE